VGRGKKGAQVENGGAAARARLARNRKKTVGACPELEKNAQEMTRPADRVTTLISQRSGQKPFLDEKRRQTTCRDRVIPRKKKGGGTG